MDDFRNIIKNKISSSYPKYINNAVSVLSINKDKSNLVGSTSFAYPLYASDIDVREVFTSDEGYEKTVIYFADALVKKVIDISRTPNLWILEVKIGFNPLHTEEDEPLRWSAQEVIDRVKYLDKNVHVSIYEAISQKSIINMEIVGLFNNKFMDLSNFFALVYQENGQLRSVNLPDRSIDDFSSFYVDEIKVSISNLHDAGEYAKIVKRYFSLAKFTKNRKLMNKVYPFINSIYGLLGQKKSEIALLLKLIKHTKLHGIPIDILSNQLENIKFFISAAVFIPEEIIMKINNNIDNSISNIRNIDVSIHLLSEVKDILNEYVNESAFNFLNGVGLL